MFRELARRRKKVSECGCHVAVFPILPQSGAAKTHMRAKKKPGFARRVLSKMLRRV